MITRKQASEIAETSWNLGACEEGLKSIKRYTNRVNTPDRFYNPKKEDCAALAKKLENHFEVVNKDFSKYDNYHDLKKLSMFAKEGGTSARYYAELVEHGFDGMDFGVSNPSAIYEEVQERVGAFKK